MAISKKEVLAGLVERVHRMLDTGLIPPWQKPWTPEFGERSAPFNPVTGRNYAGLNRIDLALAGPLGGYADPRWMGYRQAAQKGWRVRPGERAAYIHLPVEIHKGEGRGEGGPGQEAAGDPDKNAGRAILVFKRVPVFNAAQIEGIPPLEKVPPERIKPKSRELDAIARQMGVTIEEIPRDRAAYVPARDRIELPPRAAFADQYGFDATKAHELAHATGHASRLKRDLGGSCGSRGYAAEEVTAEIGSFLMCQELGIPYLGGNPDLTEAQHAAYLASWAGVIKDDPKAVGQAIDHGVKAAGYLSRQLELARERERGRAPETERDRAREPVRAGAARAEEIEIGF